MSDKKITLELRGKQVYYDGSYLFTPPVIQVDQEKQDGESWLAMRERIEPELEKAKKEEVRISARIVKCVNCHDDLLEALETIAGLYDDELAIRQLASRLYGASCLAKSAIAKAEGEQQ